MGGGNIDPFYNTMHSSGSEASSTVASPTLRTSNEGQTSPTDPSSEPKYPNVAFTTRAPDGVETKITMAMEKPGVCGGPLSTKLSLDIPRNDVSRITIGPKEQGFVLYAADGRQTTLSVSGEVTYDIQLLDSECSAAKGDETVKSAATYNATANQENDATPVPPQATSPAPSHTTTAWDAAELLQSLHSLLATPHVRAPRTRNQAPASGGDAETEQPRDCDGAFIYSQDVHTASRAQGQRRRNSRTLLRRPSQEFLSRPSQEFLTVPSPEIGLFATPVNVGRGHLADARGHSADARGRPADARSALRSVLSLSRTGSISSEHDARFVDRDVRFEDRDVRFEDRDVRFEDRDVRFEGRDSHPDAREAQEHYGSSHAHERVPFNQERAPHIQERTVSFEERMPSPEPEQRVSTPDWGHLPVHDTWSINTNEHRDRYRVPTPVPARVIGEFSTSVGEVFSSVERPSPPGSPAFESPAAPSIRLQAPTPLVGGQRPLSGGQASFVAGGQTGGSMPYTDGLMPSSGGWTSNTEQGRMPNFEQERRETPLPAGFVPSGFSPKRGSSAVRHKNTMAKQAGQYDWAHNHLFKTQQGYLAADNDVSAAQPASVAQPTFVSQPSLSFAQAHSSTQRPSTAQTNFFSERYGGGTGQTQNQSGRTQLLPAMTGSQYGVSASPYGLPTMPNSLLSAPQGFSTAPYGLPTAPYSNWTPYTGALGQGTPLTPLGITPNFGSVSPGFPLPPMTNLSSMPMLLPVPTGTGASPNTQWYTPASCSLLAPPTGAMTSSLSTSNPSPNVHGSSNGVYASSPNTLAPPPNVHGAPSPNVYGGASSNSHGPPSPSASVPRTTYTSSSIAAPTTSASSAPAHLCHAPWLAPQSLAATPTRLFVPSATYASTSMAHRSSTEARHELASLRRAPSITPFAAFTSPYAIAMPDQPEPVIPEPFRSFTPTSSPSPTRFAPSRTPFPRMAQPLSPSPEPVEERGGDNNSGWASSWVDPHAGWGEGDAYGSWEAWDMGTSSHSDEREGRSTVAGSTADDAQGSSSLYDALFSSPERAHESTSGGHATTDKKVAFARISESDWYPQ